MTAAFELPRYPYDRLDELRIVADSHVGGCVDLSVGTPNDPTPELILRAMATSQSAGGYPPSTGSMEFRTSAARWLERRFSVAVSPDAVAACVGTKEFIAGVSHWLRLYRPDRDTVLFPAISYPTYAMGADLAGARHVPVAVDPHNGLDLDSISASDAARAICIWVNSPANPTGGLDDLGAVAKWGREHDVPVFSDECYADFTWDGPPRSILEHGIDGVVAVHSLSKRSNFAGARVGFFAGDSDLVHFLAEVRKHSGLMVPGPVQDGAIAAYGDEDHVERQRKIYCSRLEMMRDILNSADFQVAMPRGGFYLWVESPEKDSWATTRRLATEIGLLVSPGEFYGNMGAGYVRMAMVQPTHRLELVAQRLGVA